LIFSGDYFFQVWSGANYMMKEFWSSGFPAYQQRFFERRVHDIIGFFDSWFSVLAFVNTSAKTRKGNP